MADSCPLQTPEERARSAIVARAQADLLEKVRAAVQEADATASAALRATGLTDVDPLADFFTADLHQKLYCLLCSANPDTFAGGNAKTAIALIRNSQQVAKHYWGAEIEPYPKPS